MVIPELLGSSQRKRMLRQHTFQEKTGRGGYHRGQRGQKLKRSVGPFIKRPPLGTPKRSVKDKKLERGGREEQRTKQQDPAIAKQRIISKRKMAGRTRHEKVARHLERDKHPQRR